MQRQLAQATGEFGKAEFFQHGDLEEVVKRAFDLGRGFQGVDRRAEHHRPAALLQEAAESPVLLGEAVEDDVDIVEQQQRALALALAIVFEQATGFITFGVPAAFQPGHVLVQRVGLFLLPCFFQAVA